MKLKDLPLQSLFMVQDFDEQFGSVEMLPYKDIFGIRHYICQRISDNTFALISGNTEVYTKNESAGNSDPVSP